MTISGVPTRLRLSVAALAEIADVTNSPTPAALANRLRQAGRETGSGVWEGILRALATPRPEGEMSEAEMARLLPNIAAVIAEGLGS